MLRDVFPHLLDGEYLESATIWECSRICAVAAAGQPERNGSGVNHVLNELILGIGEVAVAAGLTQIAAVFDARIFRVLKAAGCNPEIIGTPQPIGGVMCYAGLFDTGEGPLKRFAPRPGSRFGSCSRRQRDRVRMKQRIRPRDATRSDILAQQIALPSS